MTPPTPSTIATAAPALTTPPAPAPPAPRPRVGDWIATASGARIWPLDLRPGDDIRLADIAHHLAQRARWSGAARWPLSVARHSINVAATVAATRPDLALAALLHDAFEAFTWDAPTPVKRGLQWSAAAVGDRDPLPYAEAEAAGLRAIFAALAVPDPTPADWRLIVEADRAHAVEEWRQLMPQVPAPAFDGKPGIPGLRLRPLAWARDRADFLAAAIAHAEQTQFRMDAP